MKGDPEWSDNRLILAFRLMAILPSNPANGISLEELEKELEIGRAKLFRLMRALRKADIDIESMFSTQGSKLYHLPRQRQTLIKRILRNG
jgi:biotin operon repressor